ncbi:MAG TPA: substrate-binding domain-containing protein [Sedimentisphaerales bacterium]|nr:substrate-binding domain-containing protein [Sedimentisphaerales bacterium]
MIRAATILSLVFVLGICTAGCSKKDVTSESERLTIAVIPKGTIHEFWKTVHAGADMAGRELGVDILWKGSLKEDDREAQISVVENIITRGADGIVLAPLDNAALRRPVDEAMRSGIPVVIFDSGLKGDNYISYVATDNFKAGQLAGQYMAKLLEGKGNVAVLRYAEGSDSTTKREDGFLDAIKAFVDIEIVTSNRYAGVTTESALQAAENLLSRFGGAEGNLRIDGIFCATEPTALGILRALQNAGFAGKVKFIGFDSSEKMIAALRAGELSGFVVQNPMSIGYLGVKNLVGHIRGQQSPRRIDTGSILVTMENIEKPEIQKLLNPDLSKY